MFNRIFSVPMAIVLTVAPLVFDIFAILLFGMMGGMSVDKLGPYLMIIGSFSFVGLAMAVALVIKAIVIDNAFKINQ